MLQWRPGLARRELLDMTATMTPSTPVSALLSTRTSERGRRLGPRTPNHYAYYPVYGSYGSPPPSSIGDNGHEMVSGDEGSPCLLHKTSVAVLSFVMVRGNRRYVHDGPTFIDLDVLPRGAYRLVAVQDFAVEYRNPDLFARAATVVVVAVRADGSSAPTTSFPLESRSLGSVGVLVVK